MYMCDFHLKGQCFHPEKSAKGFVATGCQFHDCSSCTNKKWQAEKITEHYEYYQSILAITQGNDQELKEEKTTQIKS